MPDEIEVLAYYEAANLRGDKWPNIQSGSVLLKQYSIELNHQTREFIRNRAKEIYNEFQGERYKLGLGDFDNSVPDVVNQFFDETISNSCNKKYNQNPSPYLCEAN